MPRGYMPIGDFKVTYVDGRTEIARSNFLGLVEIERRWPGDTEAPGVEATGIAVYFYLGCPGDDFDKWLSTVHTVEPHDDTAAPAEGDEPAVPTDPAVGAA